MKCVACGKSIPPHKPDRLTPLGVYSVWCRIADLWRIYEAEKATLKENQKIASIDPKFWDWFEP